VACLVGPTGGVGRADQGDCPYPAGRDLGAGPSDRVDELGRDKPQPIDPHGGINNQSEPARRYCGLLAMSCQGRWKRCTDRGQQGLALFDLYQEGGDGLVFAEMSAQM